MTDVHELEMVCIKKSIMLLQAVDIGISENALRYRMKEIGEELIRLSEKTEHIK